jgi:hypothetical protein
MKRKNPVQDTSNRFTIYLSSPSCSVSLSLASHICRGCTTRHLPPSHHVALPCVVEVSLSHASSRYRALTTIVTYMCPPPLSNPFTVAAASIPRCHYLLASSQPSRIVVVFPHHRNHPAPPCIDLHHHNFILV